MSTLENSSAGQVSKFKYVSTPPPHLPALTLTSVTSPSPSSLSLCAAAVLPLVTAGETSRPANNDR